MEHVILGSAGIKLVDPTTEPNPAKEPDDAAHSYSATDKKNMPYIAVGEGTYGSAAGTDGPNDYITLPQTVHKATETEGEYDEVSTGFYFGDTIVVYAEDNGKPGKKLGETVLSKENALNETTGEWGIDADIKIGTIDVSETEDVANGKVIGDDASGYTFRLVPATDAGGHKDADGYGYLKGQSTIYVARKAPGDNRAISETKIKITPAKPMLNDAVDEAKDEDPIYYSGDILAVPEGKVGSSVNNPVVVHVGDTMQTVMDKLTAEGATIVDAAKVNAPVEYEKIGEENEVTPTVEVPLKSWWHTISFTNGDATNGNLTQEGMDPNGVFTKHGKMVLRNPYADATVNGVKYAQPTDYALSDGKGPSEYNSVTGAKGYGAILYVDVQPNPADYYLAADGTDVTLTVMGKTQEYLTNGDQILLYPDKDSSAAGWSGKVDIAAGPASGGATTQTLNVDKNGSAGAFQPSKTYWLEYTNTGYPASTRVKIQSSDGTMGVVAGDVLFGAENDRMAISQETTWDGLLDEISDVEFQVVNKEGAHTYTLTRPQLVTWLANPESALKRSAQEADEAGKLTPVTEDSAVETLLNNQAKNFGTTFDVSFVIPNSTQYQTATGTVPVPYSNKDLEDDDITPYKVKVYAETVREVKISNATVTVEENQPLGQGWNDTVKIEGDTEGILASLLDENPKGILLALFEQNEDGTTGDFVCSIPGTKIKDKTRVDPGIHTYVFEFPQTARDKGTKLQLWTAYMGSKYMKQIENIVVNKQEEYALFQVLEPTPNEVKIAKTDLGLAENEEITTTNVTPDKVLTYMQTMSGLTGPQIQYGYYKPDPDPKITTPVKDEAATYTMPLEGSDYKPAEGDSPWTAADDANFKNGAEISMNLSAYNWSDLKAPDLKNIGDPDLKVNVPSVAASVTQTVTVTDKKYGDENEVPSAEDIVNNADTDAINNPYPQNDVLTIGPVTAEGANAVAANDLIVDIYTTKSNDGKLSGHIAQVKGLFASTTRNALTNVSMDDGVDPAQVLDAMGGTLWYTVSTADTAPSDPVAKTYSVEDYVLWSGTSVTPTTVQMKESEAKDGEDYSLDNIKAELPKTMSATVAHLAPVSGSSELTIRKTGEAEQKRTLTTTVASWFDSESKKEITDTTIFNKIPTTGTPAEYTLNAEYDPATLADTTIVVNNKAGEAEEVKIVTPETAEATAAANYNRSGNVALKIADDADPDVQNRTILPAPIVTKINGHAIDGKTPGADADNVFDSDDDTFEIDINGAENIETGFDPENTKVIIKYRGSDGEEHYFRPTDVIGTDGKITITNKETPAEGETNTGDNVADVEDSSITYESTFVGFDRSALGTIEIWFQETGKFKSDSVAVKYPKADTASEIQDNTTITTLHMTAGSISKNDELLSYVYGTEDCKVDGGWPTAADAYRKPAANIGGTNTVNVPLKTTGSDDAPVAWKLEQWDDTSKKWTEVEKASDGYATALATVPAGQTADKPFFRLTAPFVATCEVEGKTVNNENEKYLAIVYIQLYNTTSNPLQLTTGNSDLYDSLRLDNTTVSDDDKAKATAELARRNEGLSDEEKHTYEDYRSDLILYYYVDSYNGNDYETSDTVYKGTRYHVADYEGAKGIKSLQVAGATEATEGSDLTTLLAGKVECEYLKNTGTKYEPFKQTLYDAEGNPTEVNYIEPHHTDDASRYYVYGKSYGRLVEWYKIVYTVTIEDQTYTNERVVKVTYQRGDPDFNHALNDLDSTRLSNIASTNEVLFPIPTEVKEGEEGYAEYVALMSKLEETKLDVCDLDNNNSANDLDSVRAANIASTNETMPKMRW